MKQFEVKEKVLLAFFLLLLCAILFLIYDYTSTLQALLIGGVICVLLFVCMLQLLNHERAKQKKLVLHLSELIGTISELREEAVFPEYEESLLSKLQSQVLKLINILKMQQARTLKEKKQMEALVSDLSHQLKTPIATLTVYGEMLEQETLSPEERQAYIRALNGSIKKLSFLIDSLMKMSRLENGLIRLKPEQNSIRDTILNAVRSIMNQAKRKHITISFEQPEEHFLLHDANWTGEAIFNLLENAVKYTPAGGQIKISLLKYEMFLRIDIADSGIGIPAEEVNQIFARFYRGSNSGSEEGLGIGLYLSRKIITEQGGYIKVASGNQGSTFSVFLPL